MIVSYERLEHKWRERLLSYARGNILEVGVGLGVNFKYYPPGANVTATDISARMIEEAKKKATAMGVNANFIVSPLEQLPVQCRSFDTIISTFSLSSYENPEHTLNQFCKWCRPGGEILLLEYGLSKYAPVNWLQRKWGPYHYRKTGTHINRDILTILTASNFCVNRVEVKCAGIVYIIWASSKADCK